MTQPRYRKTHLFALAFSALFTALVLGPPLAAQAAGAKVGNAQPGSDMPVESFPILKSLHVNAAPASVLAYNSNPPTSGPHSATPLKWQIYDQPVPDWVAVHNLEHGGIWITYRPDLDQAAIARLAKLARQFPYAVVMSPRPADLRPVVVASWGRLMRLDNANTDKIKRYILAFINNSPEELASLAAAKPQAPQAPAVGQPFPDFKLSNLDGQTVSNATLRGKPTIIWFTTSWCTPCQIGARRVSKLEDKLGGSAFNVFVVFVDPREKPADLKKWKKDYARPDWIVAFDNWKAPLSARLAVKYLDSKYLLDASGVLTNIDVRMADAAYTDRLQKAVAGK